MVTRVVGLKLLAFSLVGSLFTANQVQASFDQTVEAYGGAAAFDIILVQDCSVLDNGSEGALDQTYNAKLCSMEEGAALADVAALLDSKGFNTVRVALSTAGAQVRPDSRKSVKQIQDIYVGPEMSDVERAAYIATLRRIARGIDVDAEAHELHAKELAQLGLAENQVVIFMVTDGQRVTAAESVAQGVATTVLTLGWLTAWEESGFFTLATAIDAAGSVAWYGYRGPYSVSGPEAYREMILSVFEL
ncbi:MAG: hypothetical protein P8M73_00675 [Luminiphilus sp.]|nr:hypothetical protein [Luminiphilus sp.]